VLLPWAFFADLVIGHIVPYARGGRTSIANSHVVCRSYNAEKSWSATMIEQLCGRGGRRDEW
jgi:5-methylcytosine-specific restriction endonuclease McrA